MELNFWPLIVAPFVSLIVGFVWYNPKVFGNIWMREAGITMDPNGRPNMLRIFALCLVYSFFICWALYTIVIHQAGAYQAAVDIPNVDPSVLNNYMEAYGSTYRTFKHGALHGFLTGLFLILPTVGVGALFEKRSFKYVLVSGGYWVVTCALMGGIICAWK